MVMYDGCCVSDGFNIKTVLREFLLGGFSYIVEEVELMLLL